MIRGKTALQESGGDNMEEALPLVMHRSESPPNAALKVKKYFKYDLVAADFFKVQSKPEAMMMYTCALTLCLQYALHPSSQFYL